MDYVDNQNGPQNNKNNKIVVVRRRQQQQQQHDDHDQQHYLNEQQHHLHEYEQWRRRLLRLFSMIPNKKILKAMLVLVVSFSCLVIMIRITITTTAGTNATTDTAETTAKNTTTTTTMTTTIETSVKTQRVYKFRPGISEPHFLDEVDMDHQLDLQQQAVEFQTLDETHLNGLVHTGIWIHVIDSSTSTTNNNHRLLLLKRGPQLVTCPSSWGLVGEHSNGFENQYETSFRAIVEEIFGGQDILNMITTTTNDNYGSIGAPDNGGDEDTDPKPAGQGKIDRGNDDHPSVPRKLFLNVTIGQLSDRPFYYLRDYGEDSNNNHDRQKETKTKTTKMKQPRSRIDRQITWLMKAQFFGNGDGGRHDTDINITKLLQFDDEVSDHVWVTLDEYERMLYGQEGRNDDDNNDEIDPSIIREFCHPTIVKLARLGLDLLKEDLKKN